jgi:hypothetical protein
LKPEERSYRSSGVTEFPLIELFGSIEADRKKLECTFKRLAISHSS